jgi:hypothetical protein
MVVLGRMKDGNSDIDPRAFSPVRRCTARRLPAAVHVGFFCALAFLLVSGSPVKAQVPREYQLKAVFLYNFAQFTEWPPSAFTDDKSPIIIGIVGADPFGSALEDTIHGETISGRPLVVQHYAHAADIKTCHLLFISQPEVRHTEEILKTVQGKPVLTVADTDGPATAQVIIRFVVENNKVHFRINAEAARTASINLSSKLLRVAELSPGRATP